MMDVSGLLKSFVDAYGKLLITVVVLVVVDVGTGILSALKRGQFHWDQVANFYRTTIIPKLGGLVLILLLAKVLVLGAIPPEFAALFDGFTSVFAWGAVLIDFGRSILANLNEIFGQAQPKVAGH